MKLIRPQRKYTEQNRADVLALWKKGYSLRAIAGKQKIPKSTIFIWIHPDKQTKYNKNRVISPRRREYLREYQREWVARRRQEFLRDKACEICGKTDHLIVSGTNRTGTSGKKIHVFYSLSAKKQQEMMPKIHIFCRFHAQKIGNSSKERERLQKLAPIIKKQWAKALTEKSMK